MSDLIKFGEWWHEVGSGIIPNSNDDMEEHAKHVSHQAWKEAISLLKPYLVKIKEDERKNFPASYRMAESYKTACKALREIAEIEGACSKCGELATEILHEGVSVCFDCQEEEDE